MGTRVLMGRPTPRQLCDAVFEDLERAAFMLRLHGVLQGTNAFFRKNEEFAFFMPNAIFADLVATVARLYDDHKEAGSLRALVKQAQSKIPDEKSEPFKKQLNAGFAVVEKARHWHLAHRDARSKFVRVSSGEIKNLIEYAAEIYLVCAEALGAGSWKFEPKRYDSQIEEFRQLLRSWPTST